MIMLTAPIRFGKSTNLDIIKRFCEITVDANGRRLETNATTNYKLFSDHNLNIYKHHRNFFDLHFGNYPTILVDFSRLSCNTYEAFVDTFKVMIGNLYLDHDYLLNNSSLHEEEVNIFNQFYRMKNRNQLRDYQLLTSVECLTRRLYTYFGKKRCIVLIDDFHRPIHDAISEAGSKLGKIFDFLIRFLVATFRSNEYVERCLINACIGFADFRISNIVQIPFLSDPKFSKFYGLTESEVLDLFNRLNMSDRMDEVSLWYDGYTVQNTCDSVYNVFAIINYLRLRKAKNYWAGSWAVEKNIERLFALDNVREKIEMLLEDFHNERKGIRIGYFEKMTVSDIERLSWYIKTEVKLEICDVDLFLQYLTEEGYFNIFRKHNDYVCIRVPNKEIETEIIERITSSSFYKYKFKNNTVYFEDLAARFQALNEAERNYIELVKCIEDAYQDKSVIPYNLRAFHRDIVTSCKRSSLFEIVEVKEEEVSVNGKNLVILLITKEKIIIVKLVLDLWTAYLALEQIVNNQTKLDVKQYYTRIYLGLHLSKKGTCSISYLANSENMNEAHNVIRESSQRIRKKYTRRTRVPRIYRNQTAKFHNSKLYQNSSKTVVTQENNSRNSSLTENL